MIKETKVITQDYNIDTGRCSESRCVFQRSLFGINIYSYEEDFKEKQFSDKNKKIGFNNA